MALIIGIFIGATLAYGLLMRSQRRSEDDLRALQDEHSSTKEALARLESQREAELKAANEKLALLEEAKINLQDNNESFLNLAKATLEKYQEGAKGDLEKRQQAINKTVEPVGEALKLFNDRVSKIEERRTETDAGLREKLKQLAESQLQLSRTTSSLVQALRAPQVRGQWGELQLRRTVEMAGMINYCDFEEQSAVETEEGQRQRPDMLIRLPNERRVIVDSKVPLAAYLDALESDFVAENPRKRPAYQELISKIVLDAVRRHARIRCLVYP